MRGRVVRKFIDATECEVYILEWSIVYVWVFLAHGDIILDGIININNMLKWIRGDELLKL